MKPYLFTRRFIAVKGMVFLLLLSTVTASLLYLPVAFSLGNAERGKEIFESKCFACHTIGGGDLVGPDLKNVTVAQDRGWLTRFIVEPDRMLAEGDAVAVELLKKFRNVTMPNLGLSKIDAEDVLVYIEAQSGGKPKPPQDQVKPPEEQKEPLIVGNPLIGRSLFTGDIRLLKGGTPCMACHNIAGVGDLGGGTLGPDLSSASGKYGNKGLTSVLTTIPFPTMKPIYGDRPLTSEEQVHLKSFLEGNVNQQANEPLGPLTIMAVWVFLGCFLLPPLVWKSRLSPVRRRLVEEPQGRKGGV